MIGRGRGRSSRAPKKKVWVNPSVTYPLPLSLSPSLSLSLPFSYPGPILLGHFIHSQAILALHEVYPSPLSLVPPSVSSCLAHSRVCHPLFTPRGQGGESMEKRVINNHNVISTCAFPLSSQLVNFPFIHINNTSTPPSFPLSFLYFVSLLSRLFRSTHPELLSSP